VSRVIEQLAIVRAQTAEDVSGEVEAAGMEGITVNSHEVVFILVALGPDAGIDPNDADVLKGCNLQSLANVVQFLATAAGTTT
jgi:hypothetical protein